MVQSKIFIIFIFCFRLGAKVFSFVFFGRAFAACLGIVASSFILPKYGWLACFLFFSGLSVVSGILLIFFNEKPIPNSYHNTDPILGDEQNNIAINQSAEEENIEP
jgi:predicted MFS family arabinose efflux permease